jgi:hypothetical protein
VRRINGELELLDVDATQWTNLLSILPFFEAERGVLSLVYQGTEILGAVHSRQGDRNDLKGPLTTPGAKAQQLRDREEVDAVVMLEQTLPSYLLAKVQAMFKPDTDILAYVEKVREAAEEELGRRLHVWPREFWTYNVLTLLHNVQRLLEGLPEDLLILLVVFREEEVWTSLIVQMTQGRIQRVTTTKALGPLEAPITDWHRDYTRILEQMKRKGQQPAIGFFTDDETLRFLLRSTTPLDFLRQARRKGQVVLDPLPGRLARRL